MKTCFADTSYYVAITNPADFANHAAKRFSRRYSGKIVTTEYVLIELANLMARGKDRLVFLELVRRLQSDPQTILVPSDTKMFALGLALYSRRADKEWSLTDCISFVVMRQHGLTEALTGDRHFQQAGFNALLADST
jgi:predicted nucleic acid-binding protein